MAQRALRIARTLVPLVTLAMTAACGASSENATSTEQQDLGTAIQQTDLGSQDADAADGSSPSTGEGSSSRKVEAMDSSGTWIFAYDPGGSYDLALLTGQLAIEDSCLLVGEAVVVWPVDRIAEASDYIAQVQQGAAATISVGGGGVRRRPSDC